MTITDVGASRDALEKSIAGINNSLNAVDNIINDVILKFNIIPNSLITGFLLSTSFVAFLQEHGIIRLIYILCMLTFFLSLISVIVYAILYEHHYNKRIFISTNILNATASIGNNEIENSIKRIDKAIQKNNLFPILLRNLIIIKLSFVFLNLLLFTLFISIGAYVITEKTQQLTNTSTNMNVKIINSCSKHTYF